MRKQTYFLHLINSDRLEKYILSFLRSLLPVGIFAHNKCLNPSMQTVNPNKITCETGIQEYKQKGMPDKKGDKIIAIGKKLFRLFWVFHFKRKIISYVKREKNHQQNLIQMYSIFILHIHSVSPNGIIWRIGTNKKGMPNVFTDDSLEFISTVMRKRQNDPKTQKKEVHIEIGWQFLNIIEFKS